jgi:putative addiction module component (TIGR02574 family)
MPKPIIEIEKLSPEERLRLIEELWESLRMKPDAIPLTPAQRQELDRRLDEYERGETETTPWSQVKRRVLERPN